MKKILAMLLALMMLVSLMTGCGAKQEEPQQDAAEAPAEAPAEVPEESTAISPEAEDAPEVSTVRTDLRLATTTPMDGCDPHFNTATANGTAINLVYEPLVSVDVYTNVECLLAESYEILEGGLLYEYKLKQGVLFHNGDEMKASDVVFSLNRAKEAPGMYGIMALVDTVEAIDEYTVQIRLVMPYAPFYHLIGKVAIVSERACTEAGEDFATMPCGTGAYVIDEWTAEKITFVAFEDYHGGVPAITDVIVSTVSDATTALMAFEAGELDYISAPTGEIERLMATGKFNHFVSSGNNTTYITFNNQVAPFDNILIRQAVAYAINKEEIMLGSLDGYGEIANVIGNPEMTIGMGAIDDITTYEQDVEMAKQLLAEAGYPDGIDLGKMLVLAGVDEYTYASEIIKSQLEAVGITVEIQLAEGSSFVADAIAGNYGIAIMGITLGIDMAEHEPAYVTAGIDQLNLPRFSNERVDELFALAMTESDQAVRDAYYGEALGIVAEQVAIVPLQYHSNYVFMDPALVMDPNLHIRTWYWAAE